MGTLALSREPALVRYVVTQTVVITATVRNDAGALADPSGGVTITSTHPEGVDTAETVTHASTGVYTATVELDADGRWKFNGQTSGDLVAADKLSITVEDTGLSGDDADDAILVVDLSADEDTHPYKGQTAWEQRRGFLEPSLDPTGVAAIDTEMARVFAKARFGQCVWTGLSGKYKTTAPITVPNGVTWAGSDTGHQLGPFVNNNAMAAAGYNGMTLYVQHTGKAIIMSQESKLANVLGYYPTQQTNATPDVYDYFISIAAGEHAVTLENICCVNPYQFISVGADGAVGGVTVQNVRGNPLRRGLYLGRVSDVARVEDVHFNIANHYSYGATLIAWIQANCSPWIIDGPEEAYFAGCHSFGTNNGVLFQDVDLDGFRGVYGSWFGGGIDQANACIHVVEPNGLTIRAFKFSGCGMIPNDSSANGVLFEDTHTAAGFDEYPTIELDQVEFHGAHSRTIYMLSGSYGIVKVSKGSSAGAANAVLVNSSSTAIIDAHDMTTASGVNRTAGTNAILDDDGWVKGGSTGSDRNGGHRKAAQSAAIAAANIFPGDGRCPVGQYELRYSVLVTTAETGGSHTVTLTVAYDDAVGATTTSSSAIALNATGRTRGVLYFAGDGSHAPEWSTTFAGSAGTGTPAYTVELQAKPA